MLFGLALLALLSFANPSQAQPASPPTISFIPDQGVYPNSTSRPIAFVIGDAGTPANLLSLSAFAANTNLVPNNNIIFGGAASNRTATITPSLNQTGATTITITVTDTNGGAASNSFTLDLAYFTPVASALPALGEGTTVWGDYDNDGWLDVLITGSGANGGEAHIYRNNGNGTFTNINAGLTNYWRGTASWVDYNRDGRLDALLTGGYAQNPPQLYRNDSGGLFTPVNSGLPYIHDGGSFGAIALGDFNNDGSFDIALSGQSTNLTPSTFVYRCNNDGTFVNALANLPGASGGSLDWGDFDNDSDLDLAMSGQGIVSAHFTKVFRNDNGAFVEAATNFPPLWLSKSLWGDHDNDGDLDLLLTGSIGDYNPQSRIYRNDGGVFTDIVAGLTGVWFSQAAWADFDNDGYLDVILGGRDPSGATVTRLYRNNRNQTFTLINAGLINIQSGSYAWGDFDRDGDLDLLAMGYNCDFGCTMVQLYRNNCSTNTPPATPTGLNVTLQPGNDVMLRWSAATDSQTSSNGLTYNLRVGTNSGGIQISSPQSDLATGYRRVPQPGPAHTNRWRLVDLPKGTYYWSVQSVDTTFAGSLFSTQAVFTITNGRPTISPVADQGVYPGQNTGLIGFTVGDAETPASNLVMTVNSSNTNLVAIANVVFGDSGSNRTVILTPTSHQFGSSLITLLVIDGGGLTKSTSFLLTVTPFAPWAVNLGTEGPGAIIGLRSWVDYDSDGDLDLLVSGNVWSGSPLGTWNRIARNNGSGNFTLTDVGITNFAAETDSWGDYDHDGFLDLLANGNEGSRIFHNNGNGTFTPVLSQPQGVCVPPGWVDMDNDGDLDFLITNNSETRIWRNDRTSGFKELETTLPAVFSPRAKDVDGDGFLDLYRYDYYYSNGVPYTLNYVYRNNADLTFTGLPLTTSTGMPPVIPMLGDFDLDGRVDLLQAGSTSGNFARVYLGSSFTNLVYESPVMAATRCGWGDADGDSDLDFFVSDGYFLGGAQGFSFWSLFRNNNQILTNSPPQPPTNLVAIAQTNDRVILTWSPGTDAETTNRQELTYQLRMGTTPGGRNILAPPADLVSGRRRLPHAGQWDTNRAVLQHLPRGTYFWSAQSVDAGLSGSVFATEGTFQLTKPIISPITDQTIAPDFSTLPLVFTISDGETPVSNLVVTAISSNLSLVPLANIVFGGSGSNRTVTVTPSPGQRGTNDITIVVRDANGFTDSTKFRLVVTPFAAFGNLAVGASSRIYPADYNNDSLMDLLVIGGSVQLWRNLGGGNFTNDATGLPATITGHAAWGDYDNDGYLDLAFGDSTNIFHNDANNQFTAVPSGMSQTIYTLAAVSWGDYDGDGRLDLMRTHWSYVQLFRNLGGGVFTNSGVPLQWGQVASLGWADLNNDGRQDLVVNGDFTGGGTFFTYIYRGGGSSNLTLILSNMIVGVRYSTVAFRDSDADGDLDILLAGDTPSSQTCRVYRNDGNFTFTNLGDLAAAGTIRNAAWGDYNNDGLPDVLAYGTGPTTVFINNGNNIFSNLNANLPTVGFRESAWGDFDNDGDMDIVANRLFTNLRPLTNAPPQAPIGLSAVFFSNVVSLTWTAPVDDTTSSNGLTYAVRVGTNSGGSQILAADADTVTGFRRAVPEVNTWANRFRSIANLRDGNYFWSVQAIDSGYAGSPFAPEASFSYFHPTISGPSNVVVYAAAPMALVAFTVGDNDSPAASLTLSAFFSNTNLLNTSNLVFGGSDSNRTATITLPPGSVGESLVSIVVTDSTGLMATNTFRFESSYFSDVTPVFSGSNYFNAHWADFDNDNDLDVFYGGFVYRNHGSTNFVLVASPGAANRNGVVWGDYDRDGDLDFAHADGVTLKIFRNDGGTNFINAGANFSLGGTAGLAWGDFDNDGDLDLAVTQPGASRIYRSTGSAFTLLNTSLPPCQDGAVAWGDFDNDGDVDLLLAGLGSYSTDWRAEIFRNDGGGAFTSLNAGFFGTDHSSVAWGDIDNDGWLDALVTGFNFGSYVLKLYHNNGNGTFTDINVGLQGVGYADAGFADFDNDGWTDIHLNGCIVNSCASVINSIYRNNRDGTFSDLNAGLLPTTAGQVAAGDFDNDGDLDLLADRLYRNRNTVSNTPPAKPLSPVSQLLPDNAVLLTWQTSSDFETTNSTGLSYDVRVGTTSGGREYASPAADPANGYRRVPQRGELNTTACVLRDVPKGTFFWSVQAIDPTFAGSQFSTEGTFTITNARPIISAISNQVVVPGRTTPLLNFTVSDVETEATNLALNGYSTNSAVVPNGNIVFGGAGSNRTVTLTTMPGVSGTTTILIAVTDGGGLVATSRFDVVVQTFTEMSIGLAVNTAVATAWGDYDNDGDLDIATAGVQYGATAIYRNSNGTFTNQNFTLPATGYYLTPTDLAWIDHDNDGDLDLTESGWLSFSSGYTPATLRLRNNFPANTFTSISTNLPGAGATNIADGAMAWGDYDNDGDLDVVLSGDTNTYHSPDAFTALYRNDRGVFTNSGVALPALVRGAAAWGDYDNDGDLDLLIAGQTGTVATNSLTRLFRNDGVSGFTMIATSLPGLTDCALAFGDIDNDGDLDIALAGTGTNALPLTRIYRNIGNGGFTNLSAELKNASYPSVSWGDFDNDGFADLVVGGTTNTVPYYNAATATTTVYRNFGGTGFTNIGGDLPGVTMQNTSWGDYDNDGDLDLLAGTRVVRNNWNLPNTPPTAPTNLSFALLANNDVHLSWASATDVETTNSRGLYYNVRLGTNAGGGQIFTAQSSATNGYHRVPNFGNAGQTNFWRVAILTNGTYYWSVQAIDAGLAGSAFAAEQTFTLSRPVFSAITNRSAFPNTLIAPINFTVSDVETAASNLIVTASSSDTNLVANGNLVVSGTGTSRTLQITPAANRSGSVIITLTAMDESGQSGGTSFVLTLERFADIAAGLGPLIGAVAWGDYDNDGYLDLARGSTIYRNTGLGTFVNLSTPNFPTPFHQYVTWGDYDNDADLDLMFGNFIYRNEGASNFVNLPANLNATTIGIPAWGDSDNDGDLDLIYPYGNGTYLYRNNGNNAFSNINSGLPYLSQGSVAWGDYDKDGDLDVLAAGNNTLRVYRNNGSNTFTDLGFNLPGLYSASVAWGDFDNDGFLDFAVAGSTNNAASGVATRIYRSTTNFAGAGRVFTNIYPIASQGPIGIWKGAVAWGDYDSDGDLDLLTTGETTNSLARTRIYRNDNGNFADSGDALPALKNSFAAWGDFNNDGALDLALAGNDNIGAAVARIYRNYSNSATNVTPNPPGNLTNVVSGKSVHLSWSAGSDSNQSAGLSYNLRVGTSPGAGNILGPMSSTAGKRTVAALGNANERLSWTITNLTGGTFYWSVQAVDHSFAGSAFAVERSVTVSNRAPVAVTKSATTSEDSIVGVTLTGSDPDADPITFNIASQPLFGQVSGTPPNVSYRPQTNYFGFDQFTYRANDRTTDSVPAAVFITVTPVADVAGSSLNIARVAGGQYQLGLLAEPWRSYRIEASENLIHWQPLTNLLATNLLTLLMDADATNFTRRFYRAVQFVAVPEIGSAQNSGSNQFQFVLTGESGRNYQLQSSTNLIHWSLLTNVFLTNVSMPFVDGDASKFPYRFYRVMSY